MSDQKLNKKQTYEYAKQILIQNDINFSFDNLEYKNIFVLVMLTTYGYIKNFTVYLNLPEFLGDNNIDKIIEYINLPYYSKYIETIYSIPLPIVKCVVLEYKGHNQIDFLSNLFDNMKDDEIDILLKTSEIYEDYKYLFKICKFCKTDEKAVIPTKVRASDAGYDLTIIKEVKKFGENTTLYSTGIKIEAPFGYYTQIVPRSSISKSGYILSNSIGIIDSGYNGELLICLTRVDKSIPELTLPFKCAQLLLLPHQHFIMNEIKEEDIGKTNRGDGGFGSTNK